VALAFAILYPLHLVMLGVLWSLGMYDPVRIYKLQNLTSAQVAFLVLVVAIGVASCIWYVMYRFRHRR
jgi:fumarate reductase subunit D